MPSYPDAKGNLVLQNESGVTDPRLNLNTKASAVATPKPMAQRDQPLMTYDKRRATREMSRPISSRKVSR